MLLPPPRRRELARRVGWGSAALAMVGLMIGSGIFRVPSSVAMQLESVPLIAAVWILGGVLSLFGALSMAELAAMYPRAGGGYVFLREGWGLLPAFVYGWTSVLVLRPAAMGAISVVFAGYFTRTLGVMQGSEHWVAVAVLLVAMALNCRSLVVAALVENTASTAKLVALAAVGVAALLLGSGAVETVRSAVGGVSAPGGEAGFPVTPFVLALVTVMWTYSGWGAVTAMAGEVKDPGRSMPRAMGGGVLLVVVTYLVVNAGYLSVMSVDEIAASTSVASDAMARIMGPAGLAAVGILVMVSTLGALLASMMFGPRIVFAMARDGLLFRRFGDVHQSFGTPHSATVLATVLAMAFVTFQSFEQLAGLFILGNLPFQVLIIAGLFRLRAARPDAHRPYRTWGYPLVPLAYVAMALLMLGVAAVADPVRAAVGTGVMLMAVPVYFVLPAARRRGTSVEGAVGRTRARAA